jgi:photosystem II stability/assembly factor-like uncharacterized protein
VKRAAAALLVTLWTAVPFQASANIPASPFASLTSKLHWRSIGPYIGGRVVAVAGVPSEPSLFYMGAVQGGVWSSDNYGLTWTNITDGKIPGTADSIGAIAVAPSNPSVIYIGTGESDIRGDFDTGVGIYKTTDAGKSWQYAGLRDTHMTSSLVVDPRDPSVVYATSMGHVFVPNSARGVFKSTDGGKTWSKILYVNDRTGANVIVMDPHDPDVLYASMWQAQRTPWKLTSGGPGSGLYKTVDAGAHWTKISNDPGYATGVLGKIGVAVSPANPQVVYSIVQAHDGGVYRSDDGGKTWKHVNDEWRLRQRAFYYMAIYADPADVNTAYAPEVDGVLETTDGGKTWKPITPPGDHHIIWVNPNDTKIMIEGDDGGARVSVDGGKTWSSEENQPTGQFYHVVLDNQFPFHVYGAQQDEGAFEGPSSSVLGLGVGQWKPVALGESTFIAVDPRNPHVTYGSGYYSSFVQLNNVTGDEKNVSPWPKYMSGSAAAKLRYRFGWTHPILFSPADPRVLYLAAQVVFRSDDFGWTWNVISPDLTRNDRATEGPSGGPVDLDQSGAEIFPDIASLAISPLDGKLLWAGSADGLVHVTFDGGARWRAVTPRALPQWSQISSIEPSHAARDTAYMSASRYMWDDFHPYIYETTDGGLRWRTIANRIPDDQYVFVVRQDPRDARVLFAGTRSTVYVSLDGGGRWQPLTLNLPGVQVRDIAIDAREGEVVAATHGRGFWILDDLSFLEQLANRRALVTDVATASRPLLFAPERAWLTHSYGGGDFSSNSGVNHAYGATVYFNIPKDYDGKVPASLTFLDAKGNEVRRFTLHLGNAKAKPLPFDRVQAMDEVHQVSYELGRRTAIEPGMNAFQWDMRYAPATEVKGLHLESTDDFSDEMLGPTILPGAYTVVLRYGTTTLRRRFQVSLDPRIHPAPGALAARLALAAKISHTLDRLNRAVNLAVAARAHLGSRKRAKVAAIIRKLVQFKIDSDEGDLLFGLGLRDYLAFLMNELDLAYEAPTPVESSTYAGLRTEADSAIAQLDALVR